VKNKQYYDWNDVDDACNTFLKQMLRDEWKPDYIVGITRGGLTLAVMLSHIIQIPCHTLNVSLRSNPDDVESNLWMAEDAFNGKKILIVDDINDKGATFEWIQKDWNSSCCPLDGKWTDGTIWGGNVRFAVMTDNISSGFGSVNYVFEEIDKNEENVWLVYPWESE